MRNAYLLTTDKNSKRTLFSENILKQIGFVVNTIQHIPNDNNVISNKLSMIHIYTIIKNSDEPYSYVFEDDINMIEKIELDEIIKYETISPIFFYLGVCLINNDGIKNTNIEINNHSVMNVSYNCRGLHAIGISKIGVKDLLQFIKQSSFNYMDMILEDFARQYPANIVRYDLESYIHQHRGILFQDRNKFPSTIG